MGSKPTLHCVVSNGCVYKFHCYTGKIKHAWLYFIDNNNSLNSSERSDTGF